MTYFKTLIVGSFLAVTASAAMAQSLDPVRVEMFRSILKGNECTLTEIAAANILPRFDFTRQETRAIVGALVAAGEVQLDGNTLMLVDGSCGTGDPVLDLLAQADVQQFIAVMAENGCAMNEADAEPIFLARGISKAQVSAVIRPLMQNGIATFTNGVLRVDSAYCAAPVVAENPVEVVGSPVETPAEMVELDRSGMFGMSRVQQLVDVMVQNGCTLNMEVADGYLGEAGIEHSFATFIARKMLSDGFASMVDDQNMVLSAPYCIAAGGAAPVVQVETAVEQPVETEFDEPGVDMAMVATLRQIFAENGCRLGNEQMQELLPPAGFTRTNVRPIFDFLEVTGEMTKVDGILILNGDICDTAPAEMQATTPAFESDGSPRGRFIAAVIGNGCALEVSGAESYLADEAGLRMDQAFRIVDEMVADGEAALISDGSTVQIDLAYCAETGTALVIEQVSPAQAAYPASPEGVMIAMMRRNSCEMSMADARAQFPVAGVTIEQFHPLLDRYLGNGRMDLSVDGLTISFVGPSCYPTPGSTEISDAVTDEAVAQRNAANADMEARMAEARAQQEAFNAEMDAQQGEAQLENDPRAGLLAMLAANNCQVTQANAAELIAAAGLDFNASMQMLTQMMGTGEATSPDFGQTLQVGAPLCVATGAAGPTTPREIFINMIKNNNCSITSAEFTALLLTSDLDGATAYALISELEAEGVISLPATRDVVTLSAEMCR